MTNKLDYYATSSGDGRKGRGKILVYVVLSVVTVVAVIFSFSVWMHEAVAVAGVMMALVAAWRAGDRTARIAVVAVILCFILMSRQATGLEKIARYYMSIHSAGLVDRVRQGVPDDVDSTPSSVPAAQDTGGISPD